MRVPTEPSVVATIRTASAAYDRLDDVVHPPRTPSTRKAAPGQRTGDSPGGREE